LSRRAAWAASKDVNFLPRGSSITLSALASPVNAVERSRLCRQRYLFNRPVLTGGSKKTIDFAIKHTTSRGCISIKAELL
jgi:hypothetical protein